jgi:Leucine Rich repeat
MSRLLPIIITGMENSPKKSDPKSSRLRFLFIVGVLALTLLSGWVFWQSRLARQLDQEKAFIESSGGHLYFADEIGETGELIEKPIERNFIAHWSRTPLNINLHKVQKVLECLELAATYHGLWQIDLSESDISDQDVQVLAGMQELRHLLVNDTQVGDALLAAVSGLPHLETLDLSRTKITASGLAKWKPPASLKALMLIECEIAPGALSCLKNHPRLETLRLCDTKTDSKCLQELGTITTLEEFDLSGTQIDDTCITAMIEFPKVMDLRVADTRFSEEGVLALAKQKMKVKNLDLSRLPVDDRAMMALSNGKALERIVLSGTPVTDDMLFHLFNKRVPLELAIDNTPVTAEGVVRLVYQTHLNKLEVTENLLSTQDHEEIKLRRKELEVIEIPLTIPPKKPTQ